MFRPIAAFFQVLTTFLLSELYRICINRVAMLRSHEISTSLRGLGILYITLIARKLSKSDDGRHRPKCVVFTLLINTII